MWLPLLFALLLPILLPNCQSKKPTTRSSGEKPSRSRSDSKSVSNEPVNQSIQSKEAPSKKSKEPVVEVKKKTSEKEPVSTDNPHVKPRAQPPTDQRQSDASKKQVVAEPQPPKLESKESSKKGKTGESAENPFVENPFVSMLSESDYEVVVGPKVDRTQDDAESPGESDSETMTSDRASPNPEKKRKSQGKKKGSTRARSSKNPGKKRAGSTEPVSLEVAPTMEESPEMKAKKEEKSEKAPKQEVVGKQLLPVDPSSTAE